MNRGQIGIVEQENIIGIDLLFAKPLQDPLDRLSGTDHVVPVGLSSGHDFAVRPVQGGIIVMLLRCGYGPARPLQRDPHLSGDLMKPMREHLKGNGIDISNQHVCLTRR